MLHSSVTWKYYGLKANDVTLSRFITISLGYCPSLVCVCMCVCACACVCVCVCMHACVYIHPGRFTLIQFNNISSMTLERELVFSGQMPPPLESGILCHHNFEYNRKDLATYPYVHTLIENYNKMIWQCNHVNLGQNDTRVCL